jgi:ribonuclease P protein component
MVALGEGLSPAERVRRRPEFQRAYDTGARVHGRLLTLFVVSNGLAYSRLGVSATRKLGPATVRNRAKRLAREVFRRHKTTSGVDIVIVPRREMLDAPFASLEADYLAALRRCDQARPAPRSRGGGRRDRARTHTRV